MTAQTIERRDSRSWKVVEQPTELTCRCCHPASPLIPRVGEEGQGYALCLYTGRTHSIEGDTTRLTPVGDPLAEAFSRYDYGWPEDKPVLAPGVRVDLSRDTYA